MLVSGRVILTRSYSFCFKCSNLVSSNLTPFWSWALLEGHLDTRGVWWEAQPDEISKERKQEAEPNVWATKFAKSNTLSYNVWEYKLHVQKIRSLSFAEAMIEIDWVLLTSVTNVHPAIEAGTTVETLRTGPCHLRWCPRYWQMDAYQVHHCSWFLEPFTLFCSQYRQPKTWGDQNVFLLDFGGLSRAHQSQNHQEKK